MSTPTYVDEWSGQDVSISDVERELAGLRAGIEAGDLLTRVMTHVAWVPPEWYDAARDTLAGMAERHPSRTIILVPEPESGRDAVDAELLLECFAYPGLERHVCAEVIDLRLSGARARERAPASIVLPLLVADLPAFLRWRGLPPFGAKEFDELVGVVDRLIVDSTEWPGLPAPYAQLQPLFERVAVSDVAWARTERWRHQLASLWPEIADVHRLRVTGTAAQAHLLAGWLRSQLGRDDLGLEHEPAERLTAVELDGRLAPFPPGDPPSPSDVLSDELERYARDRVYEAAVQAANS